MFKYLFSLTILAIIASSLPACGGGSMATSCGGGSMSMASAYGGMMSMPTTRIIRILPRRMTTTIVTPPAVIPVQPTLIHFIPVPVGQSLSPVDNCADKLIQSISASH